MQDIYGADRWERAYGAEPSESWCQVLGRLTLDDLARGLGRAERDDTGRLPSIGQFLTMCYEFPSGQRHPEPRQRRLKDVRTLGERTAVGRRWVAFMEHEGILPRTLAVEQLDEALGTADLEDMRGRVAAERRRSLSSHGTTEETWNHGRLAPIARRTENAA